MAKNIKHVGQIINTGRRCVVVFREIPDEPNSCLIVDTEALVDWMHDDVINSVESTSAQAANNFYEYAQRALFTDGSNMLQALHAKGLLQKQETSNILMIPNSSTSVNLAELNKINREQNGDQPAVTPPVDPDQLTMANKPVDNVAETYTAPAPAAAQPADGAIDDTALAKSMMDQAKTFEAEAASLKEQAIALDPTLKPKRGRPAKTPA